MNIEQQVASLDLCKRLKELNVKQESLFYWIDEYTACPKIKYDPYYDFKDRLSAFTVGELGELLHWEKLYIFGITEQMLDFVNGSITEANARAKMLIHLLENQII